MEGPESPRDGELSRDAFRLGEWQIEPSVNRIHGSRGEVRLEPKVMDVLLVLAAHAGEVVSRDRLHALAWKDVHVSDESLSRAIFDLRKALGDRATDPAYIETIRKVGYRLVAAIEPAETAAPSEPPATAPSERGERGVRGERAVRGERPDWRFVFVAAASVGLLWLGFVLLRPSGPPELETIATVPSLPRTQQLTSYPGYETHPSISPDGERLAFAWDGGRTTNIDLYWHPIGDQAPIRLTEHPDQDDNPQWSPDGRKLSFVRSGESRCALMQVDIESGEIDRLADCREAQLSPPIPTPDGRGLIYADRDAPDEPFRLHYLELESGRSTLLGRPTFGSLGDLYPTLSPSGDRLAFVRATAKSTISTYLAPAIGDIYLIEDFSISDPVPEPRRLTFDNQVIAGLSFAPSGDRLTYVSLRENRGYSLWQVSVGGGTPRLLSSSGGLLRFPSHADAERIVYERWDGRTDLWQVPLGAAADSPLAGKPSPEDEQAIHSSTRSDLNPSWHPAGERIAFTSARTGNYEIWTSRADGNEPRQLTFFGDSATESPRWSADGRHLVFEARVDQHNRLFRIEVDPGVDAEAEVLELTSTLFDDRAPSWSADGRWIYFGSNRSGSWQIWKVDTEGRYPAQITRNGGFRALESDHEDPPILYYSKRDEGGIWQRLSDGSEEQIADLPPEHWGNWDLVGGVLYFVELRDGQTSIHAMDLRTGKKRLAGVAKGWISRETPNLGVAPDGRSALLARFVGLSADLLLIDGVSAPEAIAPRSVSE